MAQLMDYIKKTLESQFSIGLAKCNECGHEWNVIYPNTEGSESTLKCRECGARNSMVVKK